MKTAKIEADTRLIVTGGTKDRPIYLVEQAPGHRLASYRHELYHIPLPWVYYVIIYSDTENMYRMLSHSIRLKNKAAVQTAYCSPKKARKADTGLDWLPIAASQPHQVCDMGVEIPKGSSRTQIINTAINNFWATNASTYFKQKSKLLKHLSGSNNPYAGNDTYANWEKLSIEEVLAAPYENLITIGNLVDKISTDTCKPVVW